MTTPILTGFKLLKVPSVYKNGAKLREYVSNNKVESLLQNNMGVDFSEDNFHRKTHGCINEQEHLNRYFKQYSPSKGCYNTVVQLPPHQWGRIKSEHHATLSVMYRPTRHSLCVDTYVDIDIFSCCQTIFTNVIQKNNLTDTFPRLFEYVAKRDEILLTYQTKYGLGRDTIKQLFTMMGFGGSYKTWFSSHDMEITDDADGAFITELNQEYFELSNIIYDKNPDIISDVLKANPSRFVKYEGNECAMLASKKRCVMAMFYQTIERYCQEACSSFLVNNKGFILKDIVPCQDGFMILKELYYPEICNDCVAVVKSRFGFDLKFTVKEFDEGYTIPPFVTAKELKKQQMTEAKALKKQQDEETKAIKKSQKENAESMKETLTTELVDKRNEACSQMEQEKLARFAEFEINHLKIINKGSYLIEFPDKTIVKTKKQMVDAYEHMEGIEIMGAMGITRVPFINVWTSMNPNIRKKDDMDIYPPPLQPDHNMYNLWKPFAGELFPTIYTERPDAIAKIRNHIFILCNRDQMVASYFELWIAHMIQFPAMKSNCPILISKQGAGKGTLLQFLSNMIGTSKYHETTTPERDVWGSFNSLMTDCYLVNLNELSKQQTNDAMGVIKGLITDSALTINTKGVPQYKITSYHRWIITTNKDDPIPTERDDRRFWIVRSSDELINNKDYFIDMYAMLDNPDVNATIYQYFKHLPGANTFSKLPMPNTEYQQNIQEGNISIPERWLRDYVTSLEVDKVELLGQQIFQSFQNWKELNGIHFEMNALKLGVQLSNLSIPGILKGKHTNKGKTKIFDVGILKKHFGLGCLVQFDTPMDEDIDR